MKKKERRPIGPPVGVGAAYGLLLCTMMFWASSFAGIRYVVRQLDPISMTAVRLLAAAAFLVVMASLLRVPLPDREDLPRLVGAGVVGFSVYHYLLNMGTVTITAGQASFIIATIPIWTALLAWRFLGEKLTVWNWVGLGLGLSGVAVMSLDFSVELVAPGMGSLMVLGSALCAGVNMVLVKDLLGKYRAIDVAVYTCLAGAAPFLFYLPWTVEATAELSLSGWLVLLYLGVIPIGIGYWMSSIALAALPANRAAQMLLLIPPMAAVIAWWTIGEVPNKMLFFGGPLILIGVVLGRRRGSRGGVRAAGGSV